ncbi:MAG: EscU/YscU/HrcU family type III secretion system export apparatus switch protein [Peptostreptococcaceae bacterium]|jgi:flagellar biosynthetic protein flhB|nr:EscU/YscU/HrcU family type III secretion system export apparatus switch protein [Peptostreptococcaceae bacterium]
MDKQKKIESAVALKYNADEDIAPKVIAKGEKKVAENIVEKAKELDIPIYQDEKLTNQLKNLEIDENIPQELYEAVAQVLLFITRLDNM